MIERSVCQPMRVEMRHLARPIWLLCLLGTSHASLNDGGNDDVFSCVGRVIVGFSCRRFLVSWSYAVSATVDI